MPPRHWAIVLLAVAVVLGGVWALRSRGTQAPVDVVSVPGDKPARDAQSEFGSGTEGAPDGQPGDEERHAPAARPKIAIAQPVKASASPQAASVSEALRTKQHPERLSAMIAPVPFNKAAFEADPEKYLTTAEPGRCFQCAQPGENVPVLRADGNRNARIRPGETVKLAAKGEPRAPVTFTAFDMGEFAESKLNTATIRADEHGVASVTFVAAPGALNDCNILAGSPLASGQVRFVVTVDDGQGGGPNRLPEAQNDAGQPQEKPEEPKE